MAKHTVRMAKCRKLMASHWHLHFLLLASFSCITTSRSWKNVDSDAPFFPAPPVWQASAPGSIEGSNDDGDDETKTAAGAVPLCDDNKRGLSPYVTATTTVMMATTTVNSSEGGGQRRRGRGPQVTMTITMTRTTRTIITMIIATLRLMPLLMLLPMMY